MATNIEAFVFTIPAGTPQSALASAPLYAERATLERVQITFPPGPNGNVGVALWHSNDQVIPKTLGTFIIADDFTFDWELQQFPDQPDWSIRGYNLDAQFDHSVYVYVHLLDWQPEVATAGEIESIG